jgi:hypothetical protein
LLKHFGSFSAFLVRIVILRCEFHCSICGELEFMISHEAKERAALLQHVSYFTAWLHIVY